MKKQEAKGIYQLENGNWGYRYGVVVNGKTVWRKKVKDNNGNVIKTKGAAIKAREQSLKDAISECSNSRKKKTVRKTISEIYQEYCDSGRYGKAYTTLKKQDSLWRNHIKPKFGHRYIDEMTVAEINDYLSELYYVEKRAYRYVESFLKMFYLIYGQAYLRDYLDLETYNKLCKNKVSKIRMPKMKIDEELDIVVFNKEEMAILDDYFDGTNADVAYKLGKYCGLRINECYGLRWDNINIKAGTILVDRQMQYQNGLIKLVSLKTRNARRTIYLCESMKRYLWKLKQQQNSYKHELNNQREQNQMFIYDDLKNCKISSLELINCLPNGKIQTVNSMKFHSKKIKNDLGIHFKYHYLRHTYGTNLANLNTPTHILREQMGHANINVTMRYYVTLSDSGVEVLKNNLNQML